MVDYVLLCSYGVIMIGVGVFFAMRHVDAQSYFVGNRRMGAGHLGLSVVATDVGGGFSIGLGGLGFTMGLAGSWLLFTGLVGAWLATVLVIPRVKPLGDRHGWTTYPEFLQHRFGVTARRLAAVISALGYAGFVGAQILAGAKLATVAFDVTLATAVFAMAAIIIVYTALGGLQAVVYTDTLQSLVLFAGLGLAALPLAFVQAGGAAGIQQALSEEHLSITNVGPWQLASWFVTIVPIWFVGNTLYQRIYAARDVRTAKRAFYLAGLLEWPLMAFFGVCLGMLGRALFPGSAPEAALPRLIREVLPIGLTGIVLAAYFSAILSTADSCLLASVGHWVSDIYLPARKHKQTDFLAVSRWLTLVIGGASVSVALALPRVLDAILLAYSVMVSGLLVPTVGGLLWRDATSEAAVTAIVAGGVVAIAAHLAGPLTMGNAILEPPLVAVPISALLFVAVTFTQNWRGARLRS